MTALAIEGLRKTFRDPQQGRHVPAVDDINLAVATGELVSRLGPSGCGKTPTAPMRGGSGISDQARPNAPALPDFEVTTFHSGGTGARATLDGLDGTACPSGVRTVPIEVIENVTPLLVWRKEIRPESAGAGRTRGGFGQIMEIAGKDDLEFAVNAIFDRVTSAPKGRDGGVAGANGGVPLKSGPALRPKGFRMIPNGDRLVLYMPGGGGMGDPAQRDPALVADDVRDGVISVQTAREAYKVVCSERGVIDLAATQQSRAGATSRS